MRMSIKTSTSMDTRRISSGYWISVYHWTQEIDYPGDTVFQYSGGQEKPTFQWMSIICPKNIDFYWTYHGHPLDTVFRHTTGPRKFTVHWKYITGPYTSRLLMDINWTSN